MTKQECLIELQKEKTDDEWLELENKYLNELSQAERDEIGVLAMPMLERCGAIKYFRKKNK